MTNAQGQFSISGAPVGVIRLDIDGTTTTVPGLWPKLEFDMITISGQDNTLGMTIHLLPLDTANAKIVGGAQDVILEMANVPGLELKVFATSVTCPNGASQCQAIITQVHRDKVPMPPEGGAAPRLVWTIQPTGIHFDPPAQLTIPNIEGLPPGKVGDIFSFDHDLGQFVSVGPGTVSEDGSVIVSDPGFGIRKGGWGYPPPEPDPETDIEGTVEEDPLFTNFDDLPVGVQNKFNDIIKTAFESLGTIPGLTLEQFKAVIFVESKFDPEAVSPTGARGLLQFTGIAIKDVNLRGDLDFQFTDPLNPDQAISAGIDFLQIIDKDLNVFFPEVIPNIPSSERTKMLLAAYNGGQGTIKQALINAGADKNTTFQGLITPLQGQSFLDTPLGQAILTNAAALGLDPTKPTQLESKFNEISNYPSEVLGTVK